MSFVSFTHLELCLSGVQLSRACATSLGRKGVGFICWLSLAIYLLGLIFFFRGDLLSLTLYLIESIIQRSFARFSSPWSFPRIILLSRFCAWFIFQLIYLMLKWKWTLTCENNNKIVRTLRVVMSWSHSFSWVVV